jgi:hypothetical protein
MKGPKSLQNLKKSRLRYACVSKRNNNRINFLIYIDNFFFNLGVKGDRGDNCIDCNISGIFKYFKSFDLSYLKLTRLNTYES